MTIARKLPLDELAADLADARRRPSRSAFLTRAVRGLLRLADEASPAWLLRAAAAPSDYDVLLRALQVPVVAKSDPAVSPALRGFEERNKLLSSRGGLLSAAAAADHLHLSRQAVDKRRRAGTLIGLPIGRRGFSYPAWQFAREGTVPHLETILRALREHDPWMQCLFLLNPNADLGDAAPLDALRTGRLEEVRRLARAFGEQGSL
ncbi:MAG: hypothetical protein HYY18_03935 [Planctomycetes bacterium]|nr:hypothetical protein [Planctomycetota bacterium]